MYDHETFVRQRRRRVSLVVPLTAGKFEKGCCYGRLILYPPLALHVHVRLGLVSIMISFRDCIVNFWGSRPEDPVIQRQGSEYYVSIGIDISN